MKKKNKLLKLVPVKKSSVDNTIDIQKALNFSIYLAVYDSMAMTLQIGLGKKHRDATSSWIINKTKQEFGSHGHGGWN